ncbi:MAG: YrzE family protein [Egibacteraceae bacterium]
MAERQGRHLLGVFRDRATAESAADEARAAGVDDGQIHVQRREDEIASLRAEMRAELEDSWFSPQAGFILAKETAKGAVVAILLMGAVGAVLGAVLAFVFPAGLSLWVRLLAFSALGAMAGSTAGFIVGGLAAQKGSQKRLAAERGVTVRVENAASEVQQALSEEEPIRLDVVQADGTPTGTTLATEEDHTDEGVAQDFERAWREPHRERPDQHEDPEAKTKA